MKKKFLIIATSILLLGGGAAYYYYWLSPKSAAIEWRTAKVEQGDVSVVVTATGALSAVTTVQVGTQVSGTISKINVDFNSHVSKGQVIAVIDTTFLSSAVRDAEAQLVKAQVQARQGKRDLDRVKPLFDKQLVSQADFDNASTVYETAIAAMSSAKSQLDRAKINLSYATIRAPISGVVIARAVDVGQTVAASFSTPTLFTIAQDLTKMQVQASVDEADIGKVRTGQRATFTVDAFPNRTFGGEIGQVRLQPVVANNVVNYTVIVNVPNPDQKLMPGMTANITVAVEEHPNVLKVPIGALRFMPPREYFQEMASQMPDSARTKWRGRDSSGGRRGGDSSNRMSAGGRGKEGRGGRQELEPGAPGRVWVKDGTKLRPIRVTIGLSDGTFAEISGEIATGAEVVVGVLNPNPGTQQQQQSPFQQNSTPGMRRF